MPRLVYATCEPEGRPHSTYIARRKFTEAIEGCGKVLLDDLNGEPFEAYDRQRPLLLWDFDHEAMAQ